MGWCHIEPFSCGEVLPFTGRPYSWQYVSAQVFEREFSTILYRGGCEAALMLCFCQRTASRESADKQFGFVTQGLPAYPDPAVCA